MLSQVKSVVSHTTRGMEIWSSGEASVLQKGLSITPANMIHALAAAEAKHCSLISEISLVARALLTLEYLQAYPQIIVLQMLQDGPAPPSCRWFLWPRRAQCLSQTTDAKLSPDCSFGEGGQVLAKSDRMIFGKECFLLC